MPPVAIPAFQDNYIWAWVDDLSRCWIVDPGDAEPVIDYCKSTDVVPYGILITHHHADHIGGVERLVKKWPDLIVVADPNTCQHSNYNPRVLRTLPDIESKILEVPAHTLDHIAYYISAKSGPILFCGDALFSAGCGRLFEGSAEQLTHAMAMFRRLDPKTKVCCAHEYTVANLLFASAVEPNNERIATALQDAKTLRNNNKITLPSTIEIEQSINPFLRIEQPEVIKNVGEFCGIDDLTPVQTMAELRKWKDLF